MGSLTQDQNIFRLIPLIRSALKRKTSKSCLENEKPNETDQSEVNESELVQFKRYFCSASKLPDELVKIVVEKCRENPDYAEEVSKHVFNNEIVTSHDIRYQFQTNVIKNFVADLEKEGIPVPDSIFDRLGVLMGLKEGEFVERLYLDETGDKVLAKFSEAVNQLSMGTTGLSVWQASCDLANLFRLIPSDQYKRVVELGAGCGVSGIGIAKMNDCRVVLTDYDDNVLDLLKENAVKNELMKEESSPNDQAKIRCLDWCDFDFTEWKEPADLIIAADVVYDTALLASLCNVLRLLLRSSKAAIVACTRRNESSISCFEHQLKTKQLEVVEKFEYENGEYRINGRSYPQSTTFPFFSTLKTPTIFYNIQPKK